MENSIKVYKGTNPDVDSYSVFWDNKKMTDTTLCAQLRMRNATDIYICGLAYDVCVGKDSHKNVFKIFICLKTNRCHGRRRFSDRIQDDPPGRLQSWC